MEPTGKLSRIVQFTSIVVLHGTGECRNMGPTRWHGRAGLLAKDEPDMVEIPRCSPELECGTVNRLRARPNKSCAAKTVLFHFKTDTKIFALLHKRG